MRSHPPTDDEGGMNSEVDYTRYWGLQALPFDNVTDPRFYAPAFNLTRPSPLAGAIGHVWEIGHRIVQRVGQVI